MHITNQQKQTKKFFESNSSNWARKARSKSRYSVNVIKQRNQYVEDISSTFLNKNAKTLDVGCGTGDLVIRLLKKKYDAYGIDFASSMIKKARFESKKQGFSPDRFILNSIFELSLDTKFNLISANGFLEYISEKEFDAFIKKSNQLLTNDGLLVLGSRNRLFNVFSYNNFTDEEIKKGSIIQLIKECTLFNSIKSFKELLKKNFIPTISSNLQTHAYTGIKVKSRYQYTPCQIIQKLRQNGFQPIDVIPINIHILTTSARSIIPEIHDYTSNYLQKRRELYLNVIPQSSSFMITAKKK